MPELLEHLEAIARDRAGTVGDEWSIELSELVASLRQRGYRVGSVEFLVDDILRRAQKSSWEIDYDDAHKTLRFSERG